MRSPGFNGTVLAACWLVFVTVLPSVATHSLQQSGAIVAEAAMRSDIEALRDLLRNGADANASQGDGMSALHWAGRNGDSNIAEALIYAGANLEAATRLGGYT
ncbi:MAG: ankyrin repeat domain-containing protein, partial [Acidobacteriota bacterium]|nr:ankyrin repeat domain-containing protein [Acidobacteriota bacterium]